LFLLVPLRGSFSRFWDKRQMDKAAATAGNHFLRIKFTFLDLCIRGQKKIFFIELLLFSF
jgi:hypothetical protein